MLTTRQRILELIENRRANNAPALARALHLTQANIRHHLTLLQSQGAIVEAGKRPPSGRGRPVTIYATTKPQDNLALLSGVFMDLIKEKEDLDYWLCAAVEQIAPTKGSPSQHITQRLVFTMHALEDLHYSPYWEAHPGAPEIVFQHCPFLDILPAHPEICRLDQLVLEKLTAENVQQTDKRRITPDGSRICRFRIGSPA